VVQVTCISAEAFCRVRGGDPHSGSGMQSNPAYRVLCFTIAIVLLFASALKTQLFLNSAWLAAAPQSDDGWPSAAIAALEWILAAWLLCGVAPVMARRAAMALLGAFVAMSAWRLLHGQVECGCFGGLRVHPALTLSFDVTALSLIYWLGRAAPLDSAPARRSRMRLARIPGAVVVSVLVPAAVLSAAHVRELRSDHVVLLDPQSWQGKPFPLLDFVDGPARADLLSGERTVVLFNRQCDTCREYLARLSLKRGAGRQAAAVRVMDIAAASPTGPDGFVTAFHEIRLRQGVLYAVSVPLEVSVKSGIVAEVRRPEE